MPSEKIYDIIGKKFGSWTVLEYSHKNKFHSSMFKCICDCGTIIVLSGSDLRSGERTLCRTCWRKSNKGSDELIGQRFGKLIVLSRSRNPKKRNYIYHCQCDCGSKHDERSDRLKSGAATSCPHCSRITHGMTDTPTFRIWGGMISRCHNKKAANYRNYGARGIKVCDRWRYSFENFLNDMGERPPNLQIDRINNDGNYEPGNCRWVTNKINCANRRCSKKDIEYKSLNVEIPASMHQWIKEEAQKNHLAMTQFTACLIASCMDRKKKKEP